MAQQQAVQQQEFRESRESRPPSVQAVPMAVQQQEPQESRESRESRPPSVQAVQGGPEAAQEESSSDADSSSTVGPAPHDAPPLETAPWPCSFKLLGPAWSQQLSVLKQNKLPTHYKHDLDCILVGYQVIDQCYPAGTVLENQLRADVRSLAFHVLRNLQHFGGTRAHGYYDFLRRPPVKATIKFLEAAHAGSLVIPVVVSWARASFFDVGFG